MIECRASWPRRFESFRARLANLTAIRLGFNLIKPDGPESNSWLVFPDYDVKNRVKLEYPLEQSIEIRAANSRDPKDH
jgi:hypothetical protein